MAKKAQTQGALEAQYRQLVEQMPAICRDEWSAAGRADTQCTPGNERGVHDRLYGRHWWSSTRSYCRSPLTRSG